MRALYVAVLLAVLLALLGGSTVRIAGDIGPGEHPIGSNPTVTYLAGDIGPGEH